MFWLLGLVAILQFGFHWVLKPAIVFSTPIFEVWGLWVILILIGVWLFAGGNQADISS